MVLVVSDSAPTADFARKFRLALEALNWSRTRCARELGVDKSVVSRWASGASVPSEHNLTLFTGAIRLAHPDFPAGAWRLSVADFAARLNAVPPQSPAAMGSDRFSPIPPPRSDRPSIAVLPFANMSEDQEQEYFVDGVVEEITTALSKVRWFFVIARNSSFAYKGRSVDVKQIGRELGVRYVIEGSVRKSGDRIRIAARLVEAATGNHIWAERYDRDMGDFFAIQDEITERIVAAIEPRLHAAEYVRSQRKPPESLDAWECVMRAMSLTSRASRESFITAEEHCRRAIALEPGYSQAHSLLAWLLIRRGSNSNDMPAALAEAASEAQIAVSLDEQDPWAHLACGFVHYRARRHAESERAFNQAVELNPNLALAHAALGPVLALLGKVDAAIAHVERALRLSPGDRYLGFFGALCMTITQFVACRYADAAVWAHKLIELRPEFPEGSRWLAAAEAMNGNLPAAAASLAAHLRLVPDFTVAQATLNQPLDGEAAERYLRALRAAGLAEH